MCSRTVSETFPETFLWGEKKIKKREQNKRNVGFRSAINILFVLNKEQMVIVKFKFLVTESLTLLME